jgi:AcrR family transcriptional regulator
MQKPKKRIPAEERKKQILKCAVKVFAKSNYRSAKMADIANEAGISEAMVYKHFPSKKVVFLKILQHMSSRIITFWEEEEGKDQDALDVLKNMGLAYYKRMKKHPDELKVQFQAISEIDDKDIAKQLRRDHMSYIGYIDSILKKGVRQGTIKKNLDTGLIAFIFNGGGIVLNMMKLLSFDKEFVEGNFEKLIDQYIDSIKT